MSDPIPALHIMLDIEALGSRAGAAIFELGAVAFSPETGKTGSTFHRHIKPHPLLHIEPLTLAWHAEQGTWPLTPEINPIFLEHALTEFAAWLKDLGHPHTYWCWGSTYDFPLLDAAYRILGREVPWAYWQTACARTVWKLAFPSQRHAPRPHSALADSLAAAGDLMLAVRHIEDRKSVA